MPALWGCGLPPPCDSCQSTGCWRCNGRSPQPVPYLPDRPLRRTSPPYPLPQVRERVVRNAYGTPDDHEPWPIPRRPSRPGAGRCSTEEHPPEVEGRPVGRSPELARRKSAGASVISFRELAALIISEIRSAQRRSALRPGLGRARAELDRDRARVAKQIASFRAKLERDPISALNLRFVEGDGFVADPFEFKGKILSGSVQVLQRPRGAGEWTPPEYQEGGTTIKPLGGMLSKWGMGVAFRVAHHDPDFRLRLNWFKKSDPASGPVYLVDPVNHQYLYLNASSMKGEVLPGIPRIGILVFQRPYSPTNRLQVHFSGVSVSKDRRKTSFSLEFTQAALSQTIEHLNALPTLSEELERMLAREVSKVWSEFLRQ